MFSEFIIAFRETLEAALIVGIILSYLAKTKQKEYNQAVYTGIGAGVAASIIGAIIFSKLLGGFEGRAEQVFEGMTMLIGAVLLTSAIFWMMKHKHHAKHLEEKLDQHIITSGSIGIFLLVFFSVLREGIETVIFLQGASFSTGENNILIVLSGILLACGIGYLIFIESKRIRLKTFFNVTSILLILFAAGLASYSAHEFSEAGLIPPIVEHVWDLNPARNPDGSYPMMHDNGLVGGLFKDLFGYRGSPSLLEIIVHLGYLGVAGYAWYRISKTNQAERMS